MCLHIVEIDTVWTQRRYDISHLLYAQIVERVVDEVVSPVCHNLVSFGIISGDTVWIDEEYMIFNIAYFGVVHVGYYGIYLFA